MNSQNNSESKSKLIISEEDEEFFKQWSDTTLLFENWTHKAHIRIAYIVINKYYPDKAKIENVIRSGIQKFNNVHKSKLTVGYHETITIFWIRQVTEAVIRHLESNLSFEEFLSKESHLLESKLLFEYYSKDYLFRDVARVEYLPPNLK